MPSAAAICPVSLAALMAVDTSSGLTELSGTTCVVTGGFGFIGSNLALRLAAAGAQVRVIDNLIPQHGGDIRNLPGFALDGRKPGNGPVSGAGSIDTLIADLSDDRVVELVHDADLVFNVAGQVSHHASMIDPLRDLDLNVRSHVAFLETLRRVCPLARVILTSTRQVYGRPNYLPVDELHPTVPVDVNGIDKLACEQLHLLYGRSHGLRPTVLRLTNVFGPRQNLLKDDLGVLPVFFRRALRGEPIDLFGSGEQRRDCLHVDDVVRALVAAATTEGSIGEIINVGNITSWSLREIASTIVEAAGGDSELRFVEFPAHLARIDIGDFGCDISKAATLLGWKPEIGLMEAVQSTVTFYRQHPWYLSPSSI